ncbi:hypothetical protein ABG067_005285 [Albugo candida]
MWSEPLLPSMGKIATSSNLISPLLSSSLISKLRSSQPKNSTEGYPTESHHCANYEPSPAYSVGDSTGSHYHKKSGEDDLEYILNSYSKLISPAAMSYPEHTSRNLFPGIPHSSPSLHTTNEKDIVETPTTSAPPLVRLNSLLPPAPGIITGQIPRSVLCLLLVPREDFAMPPTSLKVLVIGPKSSGKTTVRATWKRTYD